MENNLLKSSLMSWFFLECQPDKGDIFSWMDDRADSLVNHLLYHINMELMKSKRPGRFDYGYDDFNKGYDGGWNDCLEDVLEKFTLQSASECTTLTPEPQD